MKLALTELEECIAIAFDRLRSRGVAAIETGERDFYWTVLSDEWVDFDQEPKLAVGSLDDDIEGLKSLLEDSSAFSVVDLERLSALLKFLAEEASGT